MQLTRKLFSLLVTLLVGIALGVLLQKSYPVGVILSNVGILPPIPTPLFITQDEVELREAKAAQAAQINRDLYKRVVHVYGDSIARGRGLGTYELPSALDRIEDTAQLLLKDNGVSDKELLFRYAWAQDVPTLAAELQSGMIRDGDIIVYEDAGPHEANIERRRNRFLEIIQTVRTSGRKVQLVFTTMFDYQPHPSFTTPNTTR